MIGLIQTGAAKTSSNQCATQVADVVFVLDSSSSMSAHWDKSLDFISDLINELNIGVDGVHVGMVTYISNARREFSLDYSYSKNTISSRVRSTSSSGPHTDTTGAIRLMQDQFDSASARQNVDHVAIVINDGQSG